LFPLLEAQLTTVRDWDDNLFLHST
jgi:hypothetical protein